jgi:hypothetical protein
MAWTTPSRPRSSTAFALSLALLLPASAVAAVAAPPVSAPTSGLDPHKMPDVAKPVPVPVPKPYRLRMKLVLVKSGDSSEGPGNTEDEIYFSLAGIRKADGTETVMNRRTVRPGISRDFFEMGKHSADTLEAIVFEGELAQNDSAAFALLIQEQDNKQAAALAALFLAASGSIMEAMAVAGNGAKDTDDYTGSHMGALKNQVNTLLDEMKGQGDELMGAVRVRVNGGVLDVKAPSAAKATLLSSTSKSAKVKLTGGGGHYELSLVLEDPSAAKPLTQTYLSREDDDCGEEKLWVEKKGGGNKLIYKGDGGVQVRVKDDVFHWHCGAMDEDDQTNAPNDTKMVEVTRNSTGGTIHWNCYHEKTAVPQYTW